MGDSRSPKRGPGREGAVAGASSVRLPRAYLEEAFARLTEENTRLRQEVLASRSLWQIAHQDPLTALWNRRYADERMGEELSRASREVGYRFSLVAVDVDNLKRINDQLGHASGDEALRWVARFLKQGLRGHDLCCRLGGDEFLLILPGSGEQECGDLVQRIHRRWLTAAQMDRNAVAVSIGGASFPAHASTVADLLRFADEAMYEDKRRRDPARPLRRPSVPGASIVVVRSAVRNDPPTRASDGVSTPDATPPPRLRRVSRA